MLPGQLRDYLTSCIDCSYILWSICFCFFCVPGVSQNVHNLKSKLYLYDSTFQGLHTVRFISWNYSRHFSQTFSFPGCPHSILNTKRCIFTIQTVNQAWNQRFWSRKPSLLISFCITGEPRVRNFASPPVKSTFCQIDLSYGENRCGLWGTELLKTCYISSWGPP